MTISRFAAAFLLLFASALPANALPSFARANGESCFSCHTLTQGSSTTDIANSIKSDKVDISTLFNGSLKAGVSVDSVIAAPTRDTRYLAPVELGRIADDSTRLTNKRLSGYITLKNLNAEVSIVDRSGFNSDQKFDPSIWYRLGYSPKLGGVDFSLGLFGKSEMETKRFISGDDTVSRAVGLDAGMSGSIGDYSLDLKAIYENEVPDVSATTQESKDSFQALARIGLGRMLNITAAYRTYYDNQNQAAPDGKEKITSLGASFNLTENTSLASWYTMRLNDDSNSLADDSAFTLLFISNF